MSENFNFSEVIREIDRGLSVEFKSGAYDWMDESKDGMFSKAVDEFSHAIDTLVPEKRYSDLRAEADRYKSTILSGFKLYKEHLKNIGTPVNEVEDFLKSLK